MRIDIVLRYVGLVMLFIAAFMLLSAGISYLSGMDSAFYPLLLSALLTALLGAFPQIFVEKKVQLSGKEGFGVVVGSWIVSCIVGTYPYFLWGGELSLINPWLESVSGFTTTGATILNDIEALPRGLLFWRMATCWIGGMGVVMFALVILPSMGRSKMMLSNVEMSTLAKENFHYRTQMIVQILMVVYLGLTILSTLMFKVAGMNWFDALCHGMSSVSTCGFSTKNASLAFYNSPMIEAVLVTTILVAGIHFGLIYATVTGKKGNIFRSEVTRVYLALVFVASLLVAVSLYSAELYPTFGQSFRHAIFQVSSLITTSGFATADTNTWTSFAIIILIFVSMVCACSGSTTGGIKIDRLVLSAKMMKARMKQQRHPNAVIRIKLDGVIQENDTLHAVTVFIVAYMMLILLGSLIGALCGLDLMTAFSGAMTCVGNVGPGFGEVGSMDNFAAIPAVMKGVDALLMLFGRLEIFGLIQFFFMKWWN